MGFFDSFRKILKVVDPVHNAHVNYLMKGADKAKRQAQNARDREALRQQGIREGTASIDSALEPFNEPYYRQKNQQYQNFYASQVDQQRNQAEDALKLQLSTSGLGRSSAAGYGMGELGKEFSRNMADVNLKGNEYEQGVRKDVEGIRTNLMTQLNSSANAELAAQQAKTQADSQFKKADSFAPLASVFSNFAQQYKTDQNNRLLVSAIGGGQYDSPFQQALSGVSSGASKAWNLVR